MGKCDICGKEQEILKSIEEDLNNKEQLIQTVINKLKNKALI